MKNWSPWKHKLVLPLGTWVGPDLHLSTKKDNSDVALVPRLYQSNTCRKNEPVIMQDMKVHRSILPGAYADMHTCIYIVVYTHELTFIHICLYTYTYVHTYLYTFMYIYAQKHAHISIYTHTGTYIHLQIYVFVQKTYMPIHINMHTSMYIYAYICIYTHAHMYHMHIPLYKHTGM